MTADVIELHPPGVLGCSQLANAIGVGWSSPIRAFGEITRKPGFAREENPAMRLGTKLQPVIFSELVDDGYSVAEYPHATFEAGDTMRVTLRDPDRTWLWGHPDGYGEDDLDGLVVEAKAQAYPHADLSAEVQLLAYMHLGGYAGGLLATLRGLHLDVREVERVQGHIDTILYLAERFMEYVRADEWPPVTGHPDDRAAIVTATPESVPGKVVRETREVREARRELAMLNAQDGKHGARTARKNYLAGTITAHMGDAETLISMHDEPVARWPSYTRKKFDKRLLEKEQPDLVAAYTTTTTERRLTLA